MWTMTLGRRPILLVLLVLALPAAARGQAGYDDDRVMLQGFYWESHRHGDPDARFARFGKKKWYDIVRENAGTIREARFDLIWLPPPSWAGDQSAGYGPREYFTLDNSYGSKDHQRAMLEELLKQGVEPVADIVINHRNGSSKWADFKNPAWGPWAICRSDEAFTNPASELNGTPEDQRGNEEERPTEYASHGGTTTQYDVFRDLDHTNKQVQRDLIRHLLQLRSLGYRGWRYDYAHGFHARRLALYNRRTEPTFSVGEYWKEHGEMRGWVYHTATRPKDLKTASSAFDFTTWDTLKRNKGNYAAWYGFGNGPGLLGDTTDGLPWKNRAVTFLENHDTGYRTNPDGTPEKDHEHDSFANNGEVEQGYAYLLTHPGVPCVYWKHYFDWGTDLRERIKALVNARKVADVHAGSELFLQDNARQKGVYAAFVKGRRGNLYVRIGGSDADWQPSFSGYKDYRDYAHGTGWTVWVGLPGNPAVRQAPLRPPLPVPAYRAPETIDVPDAWLE
jgi:alpha-amylase